MTRRSTSSTTRLTRSESTTLIQGGAAIADVLNERNSTRPRAARPAAITSHGDCMSHTEDDAEDEFQCFALIVADAGTWVNIDDAERIQRRKKIGLELSALALRFRSVEE